MTPQRDPATVRAVLNKHTNDNDRPSACETCCLADELRRIHEVATRWGVSIDPQRRDSLRREYPSAALDLRGNHG